MYITINSIKKTLGKYVEMTDLYINEVIFDSEKDKWEEGNSDFDKIILQRRKLVFFVEDTEANFFGCYIDVPIDKTFQYKNNEIKATRRISHG